MRRNRDRVSPYLRAFCTLFRWSDLRALGALGALGALTALGCTPASDPSRSATGSSADAPRATLEREAAPVDGDPWVTRASLVRLAQSGPSHVLRELEFAERPVFRDGRFLGLRLLARHDTGRSRALIDVRPGDVIASVNGVSPRTPDDLMTIVRSLPTAPAISISVFRDSRPLTIAIPVEPLAMSRPDSR